MRLLICFFAFVLGTAAFGQHYFPIFRFDLPTGFHANAVNRSGVVGGYYSVNGNGGPALATVAGLQILPGGPGEVLALNNSGVAAGRVSRMGSTAAYWFNGEFHEIGRLEGGAKARRSPSMSPAPSSAIPKMSSDRTSRFGFKPANCEV